MARQIIITVPDPAFAIAESLAIGFGFKPDANADSATAAWAREWLVNTVATKQGERIAGDIERKRNTEAVKTAAMFEDPEPPTP